MNDQEYEMLFYRKVYIEYNYAETRDQLLLIHSDMCNVQTAVLDSLTDYKFPGGILLYHNN